MGGCVVVPRRLRLYWCPPPSSSSPSHATNNALKKVAHWSGSEDSGLPLRVGDVLMEVDGLAVDDTGVVALPPHRLQVGWKGEGGEGGLAPVAFFFFISFSTNTQTRPHQNTKGGRPGPVGPEGRGGAPGLQGPAGGPHHPPQGRSSIGRVRIAPTRPTPTHPNNPYTHPQKGRAQHVAPTVPISSAAGSAPPRDYLLVGGLLFLPASQTKVVASQERCVSAVE